METGTHRAASDRKDASRVTLRPGNPTSTDLSSPNCFYLECYFYGPGRIGGLVETKGLPLGAAQVSDSKRTVPGWGGGGVGKETGGCTGVGEGEGGGSMRKKEGPSCWGPGWSGNDRQQAWHRARPRASSPSGQGKRPSPPPHCALPPTPVRVPPASEMGGFSG